MKKKSNKHIFAAVALSLALAPSMTAKAESITWVTWTSATSGDTGSATGNIALGSGVTVTYNGQVGGLEYDTNWTPTSTYAGGNVSNGPSNTPEDLWMTGGTPNIETITFSQAVTDPTLALWSLGSTRIPATTFNFTDGETFSIQACGPSDIGGTCISQSGQTVSGAESAGTIQFAGTYTSLSFTTPTYEYWYDFSVGAADLGTTPPPAVTPEPSSLALLGTGIIGIAGMARRRVRRS